MPTLNSMEAKITSTNNPKIKQLVRLHKASERKAEGLFLVEGQKEIQAALNGGFQLHSLFIHENTGRLSDVQKSDVPCYWVSDTVYERISYGIDKEKVLAVFHSKEKSLANLRVNSAQPLIIILERVEKPGNLGAIIRTANAAGVDAVIVCDPQTDLYNPNVIRSSRGALFTTPLAIADSESVYTWIKNQQVQIASAALTSAAVSYYSYDFKQPLALIFGTEAQGLSEFWLSNSDVHLIIPMKGTADSLNVSVSAAIIIFEAIRQRSL